MLIKTTCISYHYRLNGGQFSIPSQLTLSVSQLLTVIQCACISEGQEREVGISCYHDSVFSQSTLLDCLMNVKSVKSVSDSHAVMILILFTFRSEHPPSSMNSFPL